MTERDTGGRFAEGNPGGPGPPAENLNGQKHGLNRLRRTVEELGGRLLDGRSSTVKALNAWRTEIIRDLGGMQELTAQQLAIVDLAAKQKLLLDSVDAWLLRQPSLVDEEKKAVLPVLRERQPIADALAKYLRELGLERRARRVETLETYVAKKYGGVTTFGKGSRSRKD